MMLEKRIMDHEGFRKKIYADSRGKKTIGYGHLITENDNFEEGIEYKKSDLLDLFHKDLETAREGANQLVGHISELHIEAKIA